MKFLNNRYFTRQTFEILYSSLKIDRKRLFDQIEYEIPFDNIHNKKIIQTEINNNLLFTGIFLFAFSFLFLLGSSEHWTVILGLLGGMFVVIAFINRKKVVIIPTYSSGNIVLYFNDKNKMEVIEFTNNIVEAANKYLLNKHGKVDRSLPIEPQIESLQFLKNREIISEEHFEQLKNQLLGREGKSSIGFG